MMKKISKAFILALCAIFMVGVASCDSDNNGNGGGDPVAGKHYLCLTYQIGGDFNDLAEAVIKYSITPGDTVEIPMPTTDTLSHQEIIEVKTFPAKLYADVKITPKASYPTKEKYDFTCLVAAGYGIPSSGGAGALASSSICTKFTKGIPVSKIADYLGTLYRANVSYSVDVDSKGNAIK